MDCRPFRTFGQVPRGDRTRAKSPSSPKRATPEPDRQELEEGETVETPEPTGVMLDKTTEAEKEFIIDAPCAFVEIPDSWFAPQPVADESSELGGRGYRMTHFEQQLSKVEAELRNWMTSLMLFPKPLLKRYQLLKGKVYWNTAWPFKHTVESFTGPMPGDFKFPQPRPGVRSPDEGRAVDDGPRPNLPPQPQGWRTPAIPTG